MTDVTTGYISFSDIDKKLANRDPLFIRNKTPAPMRILAINYPSAEGDSSFNIPRTNIPFNICDHVDPESLRASKSFRAMVNTGNIEILSEEKARIELQDPERIRAFRVAFEEANNTYKARAGEQEKNRAAGAILREEDRAAQSGAMKNMLAAMDPTLAKALNIVGADGQRPAPKLVAERSPRLTALEGKVKNNMIDLAGIMSELSLMFGDLKDTDLEFIAANPLWPAQAQDWARQRIEFNTKAKLTG